MKHKQFEIGAKYITDNSTTEVVKKTEHFTTFKWTYDLNGRTLERTFKRKEQKGMKINGWLDPATLTMMVKMDNVELYACDFTIN